MNNLMYFETLPSCKTKPFCAPAFFFVLPVAPFLLTISRPHLFRLFGGYYLRGGKAVFSDSA